MEVFTSLALSINYLLIAKSATVINLHCSLRLELARQETANCFFTDDNFLLLEAMDPSIAYEKLFTAISVMKDSVVST